MSLPRSWFWPDGSIYWMGVYGWCSCGLVGVAMAIYLACIWLEQFGLYTIQ